jgi:hypothetical protein
MASGPQPDRHAVVVASTNFGGGKGAALASDDQAESRVAGLTTFLQDLRQRLGMPVFAAVQEMTRVAERARPSGSDDPPERVRKALGASTSLSFTPSVTTDWYPLERKWGDWWRSRDFLRMEEGLATLCMGPLGFADPQLAPAWDPGRFSGRVMDLPILEFADAGGDDPPAGEDWISHKVDLSSGEEAPEVLEVTFRPSYYRGNRDTDPRIATLHRIWLGSESWRPGLPEFVGINIHLGTLRAENAGQEFKSSEDDVERVLRLPTPSARYLRWRQLGLLADFIRGVYGRYQLPVVVAGDFNASPTSPELRWFARAAGLTVAHSERCLRCGTVQDSETRKQKLAHFYTSSRNTSVLVDTPGQARMLSGGGEPLRISATEVCVNERCKAPLFTHKRNFQLLDNIMFTSEATADARRLTWLPRLPGEPDAGGICLQSYYSDHLPVWARLELSPRG